MNTKTFAQESRKRLMSGVAQKLLYWGFSEKGEVVSEVQKISGGYLLRGEPQDDPEVPKLWEALKNAIKKKGIDVVIEEAAYTWFNRMMAIKILGKNNYDEPQLSYAEGMVYTPLLLQRARQGTYDYLTGNEKKRLEKILHDYTRDQDIFALLLTGYCHSHKTLNRVFGKLDDYTELLLPDNMLQDNGFLHLLNTTDAISDEDYQSVELIGWLYQFYISEKKDEVFASFKKNKKAEAKDIPAATQIFTPNWIVKYMVENTAGKIWLDKNPGSALKSQMKYLVENETDGKTEPIINDVTELTLLDPACGSGHILVEGFDLLYQMYMEVYYTPEEAVASIFKHNLFGLDIDDRAAQLATFAILLKASKVYPDIWTKDWLPQVYAMPEANDFSQQNLKDFLGTDGEQFLEELDDALRLMKQAKNLGSVMKLKLSEEAQTYVATHFEELKTASYRDLNMEAVFQSIQKYLPVLLLLTKKYTSVVANPPYMGQKSMNADLKNYVNANYPITKSDLMTIFMEVIPEMTMDNSRFALINLPSWLFLSSFEKMRDYYLKNYSFDSLLHMGRGIFGIDFGSVAFALRKSKEDNPIGSYFRLHERNFQHIYYGDIEKLFLYSNGSKDFKYDFNQYRDENGITVIPKHGTENGLKLFYPNISQNNFTKVPGSPIAYWASKKTNELFLNQPLLMRYAVSDGKNVTGDNAKYVKFIWEISKLKAGLNKKWKEYTKGGKYRKWYGNVEHVINWSDEARLHYRKSNVGRLIPDYLWDKPGISWNWVASGAPSFRILNGKDMFDAGAPTVFIDNQEQRTNILGLLNSRVAEHFLKLLNPTVNFPPRYIQSVPFIFSERPNPIILDNERLSKKDWDTRENSWDFKQSSLLNETSSLEEAFHSWQEKVTIDFFQLHANEEELNSLFIDIYGLQDELIPEVPLKDITILQEELDRKKLEALEPKFRAQGKEAITLPINRGEVVSQFISYAIGLFMGRYRLDKPGLNIANPNPTVEELASYTHNGGQIIIDEDAILPLMGSNCNFPDDALSQITSLLDTLWGHGKRTENINFIQACLDKDLEKFLVKDFYKYHCSMYKKKPIYWLFCSKNGAFQVLAYMHRMNEFTAEKIRANYLLEHIKNLHSEEAMLSANESNLSTQEARKLEQTRKDIHECEEYDMELKNVADQQIKFDLDDGVTENYKLFKGVVAEVK